MQTFAKRIGDIWVVKLSGRLHSRTAHQFEQELLTQIEHDGPKIILDLESLHAINSAGLRMLHCLAAKFESNDGRLTFCSTDDDFLAYLEVTGLCTRCHVHGTLDDALAFFGAD